jgi:hypothetical protein
MIGISHLLRRVSQVLARGTGMLVQLILGLERLGSRPLGKTAREALEGKGRRLAGAGGTR